MNKKQLTSAWGIAVLLLSGCAMLEPHYDSSLREPSSAEIVLRKYNNAFFNIYDSDLRTWIGKKISEVESVFTVEPGQYGCCAPSYSSLDVDGNGYIAYKGSDQVYPYRSGELIFYTKKYKIYNVVKER